MTRDLPEFCIANTASIVTGETPMTKKAKRTKKIASELKAFDAGVQLAQRSIAGDRIISKQGSVIVPVPTSTSDYKAMRVKLDRLFDSVKELLDELNDYEGVAQTDTDGEYGADTALALTRQHLEDAQKVFCDWPNFIR